MEVKSVRTKKDAKEFERRIEALLQRTDLNFEEEEELNVLSILLSDWEEKNTAWPKASEFDLVELIRFMMDQQGFSKQVDLVGTVFDNKARASEVFNKKRKPTLEEIKNLHEVLRIPYDLLI